MDRLEQITYSAKKGIVKVGKTLGYASLGVLPVFAPTIGYAEDIITVILEDDIPVENQNISKKPQAKSKSKDYVRKDISELNRQAEKSHYGYEFPKTELPSDFTYWKELTRQKSTLDKILAEVKKGKTLEAYNIPRKTFLGIGDFGQLSPTVVGLYDNEKIDLKEIVGDGYSKLNELMANFVVYKIGDYGLFLDFKNDRINTNVVNGVKINNKLTVENIIKNILSEGNLRFANSNAGIVTRGSDVFSNRTDYIGVTIGPVGVNWGKSRTDSVKEGEDENLTIKFEENAKKINGGNGTGSSGGNSGSETGGRGNSAGGNGGQAELIIGPEMFPEGTNILEEATKLSNFLALGNKIRREDA